MKSHWRGVGLHNSTAPLISNWGQFQAPSRGRIPRYAVDRGLVGPQRSYGRFGEEINLSPLLRIDPRLFRDPAVTQLLYRLSHRGLQSLSFSLTAPVCLSVKSVPRASESSRGNN
jgi:hypothetical protein